MNATLAEPEKGAPAESVNLDALFSGLVIEREPPSLAYKSALAAVAFAMIALPGAYLGLVGFTGWWVYVHATGNVPVVFEHGLAGPFLYLVPLFCGLMLLIFLVKPFFARPVRCIPFLELRKEYEPLLFECVSRLCRILNVPSPRRLQVDCQANASASFDKWLLIFTRKDLLLTIGLPLAAGLNVSQFIGLLAHEIGHLSQRWGMILTYVVRWVNSWLFRCVYERDSWDDWLLIRSRRRQWHWAFSFVLARGLVWVCRRILWLLMLAGHLISCYLLREMEREADNLQAKIAGAEGFEKTCLCLIDLSAAVPRAAEGLELGWRQDRLPDDLPAYIHRQCLTESQRQEVRKAALADTTGFFDTHPAWRDRVDAASRYSATALVSCTDPASSLFSDFKTLCQDATRFHYRAILGLDFGSRNLIRVDRAISQDQADQQNWDAVMSLFRGTASALRPFAVQQQDLVASRPTPELIRWMISARMRLQMTNTSAESAYRRFIEADARIMDAKVADLLLNIGFAIHPAQFGLPAADPAVIRLVEQRAVELRREADRELNLFDADVRTRVASAFQLLQIGSFRSRLPSGEKLLAEVRPLVQTLVAFKQTAGVLAELRYDAVSLDLLIANRLLTPYREEVRRRIAHLSDRIRSSLGMLRTLVRDTRYPFSTDQSLSLADHLWGDLLTSTSDFEVTCEQAGTAITRSWHLYYQVLGRIAQITSLIDQEAQSVMRSQARDVRNSP